MGLVVPGPCSRRPCRRRRRCCSHSQSLLSPSPSSWGRRCPEFPADEPPPRPRARCATRRWEPAGLLRRGRLVNAPQLGQRALDLTVEAALPTVILWSPSGTTPWRSQPPYVHRGSCDRRARLQGAGIRPRFVARRRPGVKWSPSPALAAAFLAAAATILAARRYCGCMVDGGR